MLDTNELRRRALLWEQGYWEIPDGLDTSDFNFDWRPDSWDRPYIHQFGTQWQRTGGPRFVVPENEGIKFQEGQRARRLPDPEAFRVLVPYEVDFDYSWHPDDLEPALCYVFGNQHYAASEMPTVEYRVEHAQGTKYETMVHARILPRSDAWQVLHDIDTDSWDFSWVPGPYDPPYIYVWGNQHHVAERMPTVEYHVPGATERKYMSDRVARVVPQPERWRILADIDTDDFDWSWCPDPLEPAYVYVWGNQHLTAAEMPTVEYHTPGATERKYVTDAAAHLLPDPDAWSVLAAIRDFSFDFSWSPHPHDPPYIYVWGNQYYSATEMPTVEYHAPGATERKYMTCQTPQILNDRTCWHVLHPVERAEFDWNWCPPPWDSPYIYTWGNNHYSAEVMPTVEYRVPGATQRKYMPGHIQLLAQPDNFQVNRDLAPGFDYSWVPPPGAPAYIYCWGNPWVPAEIEPTVEYHVAGATERKYMGEVALQPDRSRFRVLDLVDEQDFDWSWCPSPVDPAYIYCWGNSWVAAEIQPTIEYHVPGATERKYMGNHIRVQIDTERWQMHQTIDQSKFDMTWRPNPLAPAYIYTWGNEYVPAEITATLEYHVPGATERKYMGNVAVVPEWERWNVLQEVADFDFTWRPDPREPAYIYTWGNKWIPAELQPTLEYHVPGATERKYMGYVDVVPEYDRWNILQQVADHDFTWRPDPREPAYIYTWGNKWIPGELEPTLEYHVPGATERKYMGDVQVQPQHDRWHVLQAVEDFDFSWRPDPREPAYIYTWGNRYVPAEIAATLEYHVPGATERKYMGEVNVVPEWNRWVENQPVDRTKFDLCWRPDPREPAYIYVWGNQYIPAELRSTLEYHVPGATDRKYMPELVEVLPIAENWRIHQAVDNFDFAWRPDPREPDYIYVWGNKWTPGELQPTVEYHVPGATERKYMGDATVAPEWDRYKILLEVDETGFDFTWRPDPREPAYIYVWGNQWNPAELEATVEYHVPGATERKYMSDRVARVRAQPTQPEWRCQIPVESFDYSWRPDPTEPAYIYVFGNTWNDAATEPTIEYHAPGATQRKYMAAPVAVPAVDRARWTVSDVQDWTSFDFSWRPNPHSPAQIYQWENNGPTYTMPGAHEVVLMMRQSQQNSKPIPQYTIDTTLEDLIQQHGDEVFWATRPHLDYTNFDFNWRPDHTNFLHVNVFGNKLSQDLQTYLVNGPMYLRGHRQVNYVNALELSDDQDLAVEQRVLLDMFWVDLGQADGAERFARLQERFPELQRTRFLNSWRDTILRCTRRARSRYIWILNSRTDYDDFDFDWYPASWQQNMLHVFGSQWSHWGNTYLVNAERYEQDVEYITAIEHLRNINHVRGRTIPVQGCAHDIVYIDMGNSGNLDQFTELGRTVYQVNYQGSYLQTLRNWLEANPALRTRRDYSVWIVNSISDYSGWDWSWYPDPFQREQIHVFASEWLHGRQKFGDTLFVNVTALAESLWELEQLEAYRNKVNYISHLPVPRQPHPVIVHSLDSQAQAVQQLDHEFWPFYEFRTQETPTSLPALVPSVWGADHATVMVGTTGATQIMVPDQARSQIRTEIYDYPRIQTQDRTTPSRPLDIVFISNGEPVAEDNYQHLVECCHRHGVPNTIRRVQDVAGRVASQHAAAHLAETSWYFLVNGKVRVRENFDWSWQPDRLQLPKHYIFTVTNPVNGLEYGHQAIVANNRDLTLNTTVRGLDFTLASLHESVDINCGVAVYNTDPWTTWRTAFREAIKLRCNTDDVSKYRLRVWTQLADGEHGEWSIRGAQAGVAYWESVQGDPDQLMHSYDWDWIKQYYTKIYGDTP
jgi:hypothetical protein